LAILRIASKSLSERFAVCLVRGADRGLFEGANRDDDDGAGEVKEGVSGALRGGTKV